MKRALVLAVVFAFLPAAGVRAQDKPAKPDCTAQKTAVDEATAATKAKPESDQLQGDEGHGKEGLREAHQGQGQGRHEDGQGEAGLGQEGPRLLQQPEEEGLRRGRPPAPAAPTP